MASGLAGPVRGLRGRGASCPFGRYDTRIAARKPDAEPRTLPRGWTLVGRGQPSAASGQVIASTERIWLSCISICRRAARSETARSPSFLGSVLAPGIGEWAGRKGVGFFFMTGRLILLRGLCQHSRFLKSASYIECKIGEDFRTTPVSPTDPCICIAISYN